MKRYSNYLIYLVVIALLSFICHLLGYDLLTIHFVYVILLSGIFFLLGPQRMQADSIYNYGDSTTKAKIRNLALQGFARPYTFLFLAIPSILIIIVMYLNY